MNKNKEEMISYHIELKTKKSSSELIFDELWINEKKYKFHLSREDRKVAGSFGVKEILRINVISEIRNQTRHPEKSSKGIMLLSYRFQNKRKFISVKKFCPISDMRLIG